MRYMMETARASLVEWPYSGDFKMVWARSVPASSAICPYVNSFRRIRLWTNVAEPPNKQLSNRVSFEYGTYIRFLFKIWNAHPLLG